MAGPPGAPPRPAARLVAPSLPSVVSSSWRSIDGGQEIAHGFVPKTDDWKAEVDWASTGEMGTAMFWSEPNKVFAATLKKMEQRLREEGYVGFIDINCIANANGIYPLEFTSRFGYPTISIQQEGLLTPIGELLYRLADGSISRLRARSGFQIGVRVVVPPFPFHDPQRFEASSKDAVILFKTPSREGIYFEDVKLVNGEWMVTGTSGVVLIVCGTGPTMRQAQRQAYNRVRNVMIPNMYYREDIGDRWIEEDSDRLHSWGYLRE
jgi:phosphoribosylamine--glycine ligase